MTVKQLSYGKPVPLLAEFSGFPDGRCVQFEIWKKRDQGGDEEVTELYGATKGGKARAEWQPGYGQVGIILKDTDTGQQIQETYHFIAKIDDQEVRGEDFAFTGNLNVYLLEKKGKRSQPLDNVQYTIKFSDGSKKTGKFSKGFAIFRDVPLGKFKIKVNFYSPQVLYGMVHPAAVTIANGTVTPRFCFNAKIFVNEKALADSLCSIEKYDSTTKKYVKMTDKPNDDLLATKEELFLFVEDNTASGDPDAGPSGNSRSWFYTNKARGILDISFPLRVEVRKFLGQAKDALPMKNDEVEVMFEIIDLQENITHLTGPREKKGKEEPKTGKRFIKRFIARTRLRKGSDDNGISGFAITPFDTNGRVPGDKVAASHVLKYHTGWFIKALPEDPSNKKRAKLGVRSGSDDKGKPLGMVEVFLRPPPILGDNYMLKVTIMRAKYAARLRDNNGRQCKDFQTPTLTVWKRVRIHMIAYQEGANYKAIKWEEVKRAYRDAFIDVTDATYAFEIKNNEWMNIYLTKYVYGPHNVYSNLWMVGAWTAYRLTAQCSQDLKKYSFPQGTDAAGNSLVPDDNWNTNSSWDLLGLLAKEIIKAKLSGTPGARPGPGWDWEHYADPSKYWETFKDPSKGRKIGICLLFCQKPSDNSNVCGAHSGGKIFYMVPNGDVTNTFVHEMGHALFLEHGATAVARATRHPGALLPPVVPAAEIRALSEASIVIRTEASGSSGPFFDQHDSEDMVSCVMSYSCDRYDGKGNLLPKKGKPKAYVVIHDNPTDWHFCGVCLLQLRFYDGERMLKAANPAFRKMQYSRKPRIVLKDGGPIPSPTYGIDVQPIKFPHGRPPHLTLPTGNSRDLCILYRKEGVEDQLGRNPFKDLSYLTETRINGLKRAEWHSTRPHVAMAHSVRVGDVWVSRLEAISPGTATITFKIRRGHKQVVKSKPFVVKVT